MTINQAPYPLPKVEELLSALSGGKYFTKLVLANAYLQLPLEKESQEYCTSLMQGLENVFVYIDDILITGATMEEHLKTLKEVLRRLTVANVQLKRSKCFFLQISIEYLGYLISEKGIQPTD